MAVETYRLDAEEKGDRPRETPPYATADLKDAVLSAVSELYLNDYHLIQNGLTERALTIRLVLYLQQRFLGYDVDGEYNRNMSNPKAYIRSNGRKARAEPDVLVHRRGYNCPHNLIAVEAKRKGHGTTAARLRDRDKLSHLVNGRGEGQEYLYQLGVFIDFGINEFDCEFFESEL